jgi:hypothetical protein
MLCIYSDLTEHIINIDRGVQPLRYVRCIFLLHMSSLLLVIKSLFVILLTRHQAANRRVKFGDGCTCSHTMIVETLVVRTLMTLHPHHPFYSPCHSFQLHSQFKSPIPFPKPSTAPPPPTPSPPIPPPPRNVYWVQSRTIIHILDSHIIHIVHAYIYIHTPFSQVHILHIITAHLPLALKTFSQSI